MISITRAERYSIELEFDLEGAKAFLHTLESALNSDEMTVKVEADSSIFRGRRKRTKSIDELKVVKSEREAVVYQPPSTIVFELDTDCLVYGIARLNECFSVGYFSPAEFCEVILEKTGDKVTIYCHLRQ